MKTKIDELKEKARMKIIGKVRQEKTDDVIEPYDGENATYTSNDEDYAEFLKNLNIITSDSEKEPVNEAVSVEDTMSFKIKRSIPKQEEKSETETEIAYEEPEIQKQENDVADNMQTKYVSMNDDKLFTLTTSVERLTNIVENSDIRREHTSDKMQRELEAIKSELNLLKTENEKLRNNVSDLTKVSDSVFDLKNTQQGTKASMLNLETGFNRLKKKFVACMTLLSILGFIIIALEILNLLS